MVRVDTQPEDARTDCGPACAPNFGGGGNGGVWTARDWEYRGGGLSMLEIDDFCRDALTWKLVTLLLEDAMGPDSLPTLSGMRLGELTAIIPWLEAKGFFNAARLAQEYARQYGGGAVLCCLDDGTTSNATEVQIADIDNIIGFYAIPKWYITPNGSGSGRVAEAWYGTRVGRPEFYTVDPQGGDGLGTFNGSDQLFPDQLRDVLSKGGRRFHRSRVIPWQYRSGMDLRQARRYAHWNGWGPGVVESCLSPLIHRREGMLRLNDLLGGLHMNVLKMPNLLTGLTTPTGGGALKTVLDVVKACLRYTEGGGLPLVAIDNASTLTAESHNASGISDLIGEQRRYLLDNCEYPEVVLFGAGGSNGLSGDGNEGQWRAYYSKVKSIQSNWCWSGGPYGGGIRQAAILAMACKCGPTNGVIDLTIKANWPSLWQDSDKSRAETRLKDCQARASDVITLGLTPDVLARNDPTVKKAYPSLDVQADPGKAFPPDPVGGASLEQAQGAKAALSPATTATAQVEDAENEGVSPHTESEVVQDALPPPAEWPKDFVTESELQSALQMSRASLRKWMSTQEGIIPFPTAKGTKGGHRYSLSQVLGAWQASAKSRVDALRKK